MNNDILNEFCDSVIPYLNDYNNIEYILSLLIRDIRNNNIIYINLNNTWYEYNPLLKKWAPFDFKNILNKINNFYEFFNLQLINYINNNELLNTNNKNKFCKLSYRIAVYIKNEAYNINKIYEYCSSLFSINNII